MTPRLVRILSMTLVLSAAMAGEMLRGEAPNPAATLPDSHVAGLGGLIDKAVSQSPQMLAQDVSLARAAGGRLIARSGLFPSLNGNARYADMAVSTTGTPNSTRVGLDYNLSLNQPVFHWGELMATAKMGDLDRDIAQKHYAQAYRDLVGQVRTQYLRLILQKKALMMRERLLKLSEKSLAYDKQRLAAGQITAAEFAGHQADFDDAQLAYDRDSLAFSQALTALGQMTGVKTIQADSIPTEIPNPEWTDAQAATISTYFVQSGREGDVPSLLIARDQLRESELRYKVARVRLLPKVDLTAQTMLMSQTYLVAGRATQSATHEQLAGVAVNWPIFDGLNARGAKQQALADRREAELQLQTEQATLAMRRQDAVQQCDLSARALALAERRLKFAQGALSYLQAENKANRASDSQVEDARTSLLNVELAAMSARADLFMRWSDLVGLLWMDPALDQIPASYLRHGK